MMGHDWITWLAAIIALCFCAYIMGKEDGQKEGGGLSEEARIEIEKYEIDKKYALYEKMANEQKDPAIRKPLTLEELKKAKSVWIECSDEDADNPVPVLTDGISDKIAHFLTDNGIRADGRIDQYGSMWRAWASEPTNEERAAAPWEEADNADL